MRAQLGARQLRARGRPDVLHGQAREQRGRGRHPDRQARTAAPHRGQRDASGETLAQIHVRRGIREQHARHAVPRPRLHPPGREDEGERHLGAPRRARVGRGHHDDEDGEGLLVDDGQDPQRLRGEGQRAGLRGDERRRPEEVVHAVEVDDGVGQEVRRLEGRVAGRPLEVVDVVEAERSEGDGGESEGDGDGDVEAQAAPEDGARDDALARVREEGDAEGPRGEEDEEGVEQALVPEEHRERLPQHLLVARAVVVGGILDGRGREGLQEQPHETLEDEEAAEAEQVFVPGDGGTGVGFLEAGQRAQRRCPELGDRRAELLEAGGALAGDPLPQEVGAAVPHRGSGDANGLLEDERPGELRAPGETRSQGRSVRLFETCPKAGSCVAVT